MNGVNSDDLEFKMSTLIFSSTLGVKRRRTKGSSDVKVRKRILRVVADGLMKGRQPEKRMTGERPGTRVEATSDQFSQRDQTSSWSQLGHSRDGRSHSLMPSAGRKWIWA